MKLFFTISLYFITINLFSQLNFTIRLNKGLDPNKIKIFYSDGSVKKFINLDFINNAALTSEAIQSRYARIIIMYPDKLGNLPGKCFLVSKKKSFIKFNEVADTIFDKLSNYESRNIIDVTKNNIYTKLNKFTEKELRYFNIISKINNNNKTDSTTKLVNETYEKLALKQLQFIKLNGKEYFFFEKFIQDIVPTLKSKNLLELYEVFNTIFPTSFKESYEGKSAKAFLEGNLNVKIGMKCPQFKTIDYLGNELNSEKLKGKYYLLSFWATWCGPCLKEIPQLKNIRTLYSEDKLSIISISRDTDSSKFITGINKYNMNWINVFHDPIMENLFGEKPIPSLYLVDRNGKLIFSSWEKNIEELDTILRDELK